MRGKTPLRTIAGRVGLSYSYLANVEAGRRTLSEPRARQVLQSGFGMGEGEIERSLLEVHLRDHGLGEKALRTLVIDLAQDRVPEHVRQNLYDLYHGYTSEGDCQSFDP